MSYRYDVFISYRRTDLVGRWVQNHFYPEFQMRLDANAGFATSVFCDTQLQEGDDWAGSLKANLRDSKLLIPIWSADYFRSKWCMTEWMNFLERQRILGTTKRLFLPIRYSDGNFFPASASAIQYKDLSRYTYPDEVFRRSERWMEFTDKIDEFVATVLEALDEVPEWQDLPVSEFDPLPPVQMTRPRL
jgi:hypothetical protein